MRKSESKEKKKNFFENTITNDLEIFSDSIKKFPNTPK
jgi:hypothetical protein